MYAHEVMEYLLRPKKYRLVEDLAISIREPLKNAIKFHLGEGSHYINILNKGNYKLGFTEGIYMPYKVIWFDWTVIEQEMKVATLCIQLSSTVLYVIPFSHFKEKGWSFTQIVFFILQGGATADNVKVIKQISPLVSESKFEIFGDDNGSDTKVAPLFLSESISDKDAFKLCRVLSGVIDVAITLLTCKNVQEVSVPAPVKLNKKRLRNNKVPIFTHKVLKVVVPKKIRDNLKNNTDILVGAMPLHLRIGHFKVYTKERPLFGKCVGKFWWTPRPRGDKKNGVIEKEYNIKVKDDTVQ